jgi:SulP family sulfate permease
LAPLAEHIPLASLAAMLFFVAYTLVDTRSIWRILRTSRADAAVCLATLAAALFVPLTYAIYVGIFLSISLYLRKASRLHLMHLAMNGRDEFEEHPFRSLDMQHGDVIFLQLQGDLFFGLADELTDKLRELVKSHARVVIFRLKRTHSIDATVLFAFEQFVEAMRDRHAHVIFCGVPSEVRHALRAFGIEAITGAENIFGASTGVFGSAKLALQRAREILEGDSSVDGPRASRSSEARPDGPRKDGEGGSSQAG